MHQSTPGGRCVQWATLDANGRQWTPTKSGWTRRPIWVLLAPRAVGDRVDAALKKRLVGPTCGWRRGGRGGEWSTPTGLPTAAATGAVERLRLKQVSRHSFFTSLLDGQLDLFPALGSGWTGLEISMMEGA